MKMFRAATCAFLALHLPARAEEVDASRLLDLPPAQIVVLGEVHDNPLHHANQAAAVAALRPRALVWEMLTPDQAARMPQDRGDAAAVDAAIGWTGSGWPDFAMYHPILAAAPGAAIHGAAVPSAELRRVRAEGVEAVFGPDAGRYGLLSPLPAGEQAAREADQQASHCNALPETALPGMVLSQRIRDAALARAALTALAETGGPVAVITGSGHARRDRGMTLPLLAAAPGVTVLSVGQVERPADTAQPFDLWIVTEPTPRDDPCKAFRK